MTELFFLRLMPSDTIVQVSAGQPLRDVLAGRMAFPCGGKGTCRNCRVRVSDGSMAVTEEMREAFSEQEIAAGWRLACHATVSGPVTLEIPQGTIIETEAEDATACCDDEEAYGIAVDLGTTTLAVALVALSSGRVLRIRGAMNPQAAWGADIMSRVQFAQTDTRLTGVIRNALATLIAETAGTCADKIHSVVLVGNTVMHHLFCGHDIGALAEAPFETPFNEDWITSAEDLGWPIAPSAEICFLRPIGGFVGSDISAGLMACGIANSPRLCAFVDLGTNGEVAIGNNSRILVGSTAAGPAFEAGCISCGMLAIDGAISHVGHREGCLTVEVLGGGTPKGVCGSGLVDAVAVGLELGLIQPNGRSSNRQTGLRLAEGIGLTQADLRELQLAKAAIASGFRILLERWGAEPDEVETVFLAGSFGNYIDIAKACRIGLLEFPPQRILAMGNTALKGAILHLRSRRTAIAAEHIAVANEPGFMDAFVDCLSFPAA